jgi:hypothetical protein
LERLVVDLSSEQVLATLEEALAAGIVEEVPGTFGTYQFIHVLIQETLASTLSSARRARLHGHIAEVLEAVWQDDLATHAAELVAHFAQAEPVHSREKLATYALLAGERALAAFAHEEALLHFERGITAKAGQPMDAEAAALLFGLGRAQGATDQVQQTWPWRCILWPILPTYTGTTCTGPRSWRTVYRPSIWHTVSGKV